ncbi:NAD(P)-dependent oxidoreductase, partial [Candidatus Saccharibacteria bacterium]|nr:NAD(P)-dependent oxidoreductase [Candidatus Saccharibacteria bacterium]
IAAAYVAALMREPDGAHVFNLVGSVASCEDVVAIIKRHVNDARISIDGPALTSPPDVPEGNVRDVLKGLPATTLEDGIAATIAYYRNEPR